MDFGYFVSIVLGLVCLVGEITRGRCCSSEKGWRPPTTTEIALRAKIILYGKVLNKFPDPRFNYGDSSSVYTVELEVYCVLKGNPTSSRVNLTQTGYVPGHCFSTQFVVNEKYIVIASQFRNTLMPAGSEIHYNDKNLADVMKACNINPQYPLGVQPQRNRFKCPRPTHPCLDLSSLTTTTTTASNEFGEYGYEDYYVDMDDDDDDDDDISESNTDTKPLRPSYNQKPVKYMKQRREQEAPDTLELHSGVGRLRNFLALLLLTCLLVEGLLYH